MRPTGEHRVTGGVVSSELRLGITQRPKGR
jgi:hypothetical protein